MKSDVTGTAELTHDDASKTIIEACADDLYYRITHLNVSVYKAAQGEGGILEILDTDGGRIWSMSVDTVYNKSFDFGRKGLNIGKNVGIEVVVSGAQTQASCWIHVKGHLDLD